MANKWLAHVKKTMKLHKGKKFGDILKAAKKTWHKGKKGGADEAKMEEPKMEDKMEEPKTEEPKTGLEATAGRRRTRRRRHSRR
jgi:hypothetical protein